MKFGIAMFPTDYSITPSELGRAVEERGFESLWFPEHTHIPTSRKSPWPGDATMSCRPDQAKLVARGLLVGDTSTSAGPPDASTRSPPQETDVPAVRPEQAVCANTTHKHLHK